MSHLFVLVRMTAHITIRGRNKFATSPSVLCSVLLFLERIINQRVEAVSYTHLVGEVIKDAIGKGCRRFIIGIGGSATNDGGIGMLQALGFGFMNKNGQPVPFGARGLEELETITDTYVIPRCV